MDERQTTGWRRLLALQYGRTFCIVRGVVIAVVLGLTLPIGIGFANQNNQNNPPTCRDGATLREGESCRVLLPFWAAWTISWTGPSASTKHMSPTGTVTNNVVTVHYAENAAGDDGGTVVFQARSNNGFSNLTLVLENNDSGGTTTTTTTTSTTTTTTTTTPTPTTTTVAATPGKCEVIFPGDGTVEVSCGKEGDNAYYLPGEKGVEGWAADLAEKDWPKGWDVRADSGTLWVSVSDDNIVQRQHEVAFERDVGLPKHTFRFHDDDMATLTAYNTQWRQWDFILSKPVEGETVTVRLPLKTDAKYLVHDLNSGANQVSWEPGESGVRKANFGRKYYYNEGRWLYHCVDGPEATVLVGVYDEDTGTLDRAFGPREGSGLPMVIVEPAEIDICRP